MEDLDSDSDCASSDSGLETGNSNLEPLEVEPDSYLGDNIYENTGMTANLGGKPLERYEFGRQKPHRTNTKELQDVDSFEGGVEPQKIWGVRSTGASSQHLPGPPPRSINPTEDKIAQEIKELKEREDELRRLREFQEGLVCMLSPAATPPAEEKAEHNNSSITTSTNISNSSKVLMSPASHTLTQALVIKTANPTSSNKFNPNLYRPVILSPRPRIMQEFLVNGGKVTAFTQPDSSVIQLRKPQVHKSQPKVCPPTVSSVPARKPASALDKIQEELMETRRREEELRNLRKEMFRSQPDLSRLLRNELDEEDEMVDDQAEEAEELEEHEEEEEEAPSLLHTRGKSGLISVWENRIQNEKLA